VSPHARQELPPVPHCAADGDWHAPLAQQPFGHEAASHTHDPLWHSRPAAHAGPLPHVHTPADEHPSAFGPHAVHPVPPGPHVLAVRVVLQTDPVQHPVGHAWLQPVHVPALQNWPDGHELHAPPPEPQLSSALPGMHVDPLQHPSHVV
jgi:hypothetical protein